jgi:WD40 repeat protein
VLSFFEDWRVISGSKDGTVHLYDLQSPINNIKYQHLFQTYGNSIVEIGVSDHGIGFAIDNQKNLRAYDLFHFRKVFKVMPLDPRGKNVSFMMSPSPLLNAGKEQLCILVDENDAKSNRGESQENDDFSNTSQSWNKKKCILIYRILDNLMATFPGLANIVKKGIEKSKAMIAFSKLSTAELNNPNFEVPLLEVGKLTQKTDTKSQSGSVSRASGTRKYSTSRSPDGKYKEPSLSELNQTYASVDKNLRKKSNLVSPPKKSTALTHANLHPEKYLTEKPSFPKIGLVVPAKNTMDKLREMNSNKVTRVEKLQQYYNQVQDELNQKEELERLQKRKEMLKETGY